MPSCMQHRGRARALRPTPTSAALISAICWLPLISSAAVENIQGLNAIRQLSASHVNMTKVLYDASLKGNLAEVQAAYAAVRPSYEAMETLAGAFPDLDSDIDARAYGFPDGAAFANETVAHESGAIFKGNHRVEEILFRERNVSKAQWWIADLVNSSIALSKVLADMKSFSAEDTWAGIIDVAFEVGNKKFSSEEETYSDLSIIIFSNNFKGIDMQFEAYEDEVRKASPEVFREVEAAIQNAMASVAPFEDKTGELGGVTPYSRVSIADRKRIQAAAYRLAESLEKAAVAIGVRLEDEDDDGEAQEDCTPSVNTATFAADTSSPVVAGLNYFRALLPYQAKEAQALTAAIKARNLTAAKAAYTRMRPIYEQIEVLAPVFPATDSDIDAREYSFPEGELSDDFKGNHRLERLIFRDGDLGARTLNYSEGLERSFAELAAALNKTNNFTPSINFQGIIGLTTEVPAKKVSSEEETSSGLSHLIFYNNWKGIYSQTAPYLSLVPKPLRDKLRAAVTAAAQCLPITTRDDILAVNASDVTAQSAEALASADYGSYFTVTDDEKQCIVSRGYAVRDAVLDVARAARLMDDCNPYLQSPLYRTTPNMTFVEQRDGVSDSAVTSAVARVEAAADAPTEAQEPSAAAAAPSQTPSGSAAKQVPSSMAIAVGLVVALCSMHAT